MNLDRVLQELPKGPVTFKAVGNSMTPKIRSGDTVTVAQVDSTVVKKNDIVLARVKGRLYLHLVSAVEKDRVQISNNKGHVNGWTSRAQVFGRVVK
jgi:phage repressor protein C with HTH and peptisase S24 domain